MSARKRVGQVSTINGPWPTQSTESLKEFIEDLKLGIQNKSTMYAIEKAEKMIADRKAGITKEPEVSYP